MALENKELADILEKFHETYISGLRTAMKISTDWEYRSAHAASTDDVEKLFDLIGEDQLRYVSGTRFENGTERFSIFVGPEGINRLKEYQKKRLS